MRHHQVNISPKKASSDIIESLFTRAGIPTHQNVTRWTELDSLYDVLSESLYTTASEIFQSLKLLRSYDANDPQLAIMTRTVSADTERFTDRILAIKKRYSEKIGIVETPEDLSLYLDCFNDYQILSNEFKGVMVPAAISISDYVIDLLNKQKSVKKESDVNHE